MMEERTGVFLRKEDQRLVAQVYVLLIPWHSPVVRYWRLQVQYLPLSILADLPDFSSSREVDVTLDLGLEPAIGEVCGREGVQ